MSSLSLMGSASAQAYVNERGNLANATSRNVAEPYRHLLSKTCREGSRAGLFRPFRERPHYDPQAGFARDCEKSANSRLPPFAIFQANLRNSRDGSKHDRLCLSIC